LGYYFNQQIDNLPNSIFSLTLGYEFNNPINNLPNSLTNLTLGNKFNKPINKLPSSLNKIIINKYNKNIIGLTQQIKNINKKIEIITQ